jgi:hypothetical protein
LATAPKKARVRTLVARYYPALYSFASRLVDDPQEALLVTDGAFDSTLKQLRKSRDENVFASMLMASVIHQVTGNSLRTGREPAKKGKHGKDHGGQKRVEIQPRLIRNIS